LFFLLKAALLSLAAVLNHPRILPGIRNLRNNEARPRVTGVFQSFWNRFVILESFFYINYLLMGIKGAICTAPCFYA